MVTVRHVLLVVLAAVARGGGAQEDADRGSSRHFGVRTAPLETKLRHLTSHRPRAARMLAASQGGTSGVGWRWARLADALHTRSAKIVVIGGSITAGNGLHAGEQKYSCALAAFLNHEFRGPTKHSVINVGLSGQGTCFLMKFIRAILKAHGDADLFVLEFAVNDLPGGETSRGWWEPGGVEVAQCLESIVLQIRALAPKAALLFVELTCKKLQRITAEPQHSIVAGYHHVPVVSLKAAFLPFFMDAERHPGKELLMCVGADGCSDTNAIDPCAQSHKHWSGSLGYDKRCRPDLCNITEISLLQTRSSGQDGARPNGPKDANGEKTFMPNLNRMERRWRGVQFADDVHLGCTGHALAADVIAFFLLESFLKMELVASANGRTLATMYPEPHIIDPPACCISREGNEKERQTQIALANWEFACLAPFSCEPWVIQPNPGPDSGWASLKHHAKRVWLHSGPATRLVIPLQLNAAPRGSLHAVTLDYLRSYEGMGKFTAECVPGCESTPTVLKLDGLWDHHVSIGAEVTLCVTACRNATITITPEVVTADDPTYSVRGPKGGEKGQKIALIAISSRFSGINRVVPTEDVPPLRGGSMSECGI
eukprot:m.41998 g.41998  ORF g.41998 m.41998 type:complete len:599 (+) comp8270_c0_seq1:60-1856(+)